MKFFFAHEFSMVDTMLIGVAAHGYAQGDILAPLIVSAIGLVIHLAVGCKYNAPAA